MSDILPTPSRMNLQLLKQKKQTASNGYSLLKKKSDALSMRFRKFLGETLKVKERIGSLISDASFSVSKAVWAVGDFENLLLESISRTSITLDIMQENIAGVRIPKFVMHVDHSADIISNLDLATGGQVIESAKNSNLMVIQTLVELASMQIEFSILDEQIRITNQRVNALDNVVLPRIDSSIEYIKRQLEEIEREEFFRLKMVKEKKQEELNNEKHTALQTASIVQSIGTQLEWEDEDVVI
ncbi:V-type H+-transporting ATPase subunit D [Babesia microti strain RI]|uniref:V-type H+-transporting ATPase subunit D n=1 Tax=Babesia microti (strain RI) TaxID=1133968 RepID=A0A1N6LXA4_BABMR|nr:V-type H+-transporting ATPase subunit D [Babesia microti strain RI]SIO73492.1 V-type H+-transporting ATPase subunit D [Babesia microti strain RI]|eukprot:XP_021337588.1 V-type H+-transporting ATPase subunit D [Babesia microti strain RI]